MTSLSSQERRAAAFEHLKANPNLSVLVVGGGINGAGTFRDLALQGVDCLIVDKGDWCSGTSAAPSRLIHGGLKYLETGEFRLVAESARERNLLLRNAPHLVKPLPTVVPIHSVLGGIVPSLARLLRRRAKLTDRGLLVVELGLALYDWLGRHRRTMPRHRIALRRTTRRRFPAMAPCLATATYHDARVTQAERLCYELVADGEAALPDARALNYVAVTAAADGRVTLTDQVTGEAVTVSPRVVVNAAGPWIDRVNGAVGLNKRYIGGTKGSHLVVDDPALVRALDGHMVYFGSADGRICLAYPFFDRVLIGSTDLKADEPDAVACSDAEADYMLQMVGEVFPGLALSRDKVVYRYAGIRPLPAADVDDPGEISRDHSIGRDRLPGSPVPVLSLIGGKWTTFRALAAQAADEVLAVLGHGRRTDTADTPIGGGRKSSCPGGRSPRLDRAGLRRAGDRAGAGRDPARPLRHRCGVHLGIARSGCRCAARHAPRLRGSGTERRDPVRADRRPRRPAIPSPADRGRGAPDGGGRRRGVRHRRDDARMERRGT